MPKPPPDIDALAKSAQRAKEIFVTPWRPGGIDSAARAYGYLEMAVERFLEGRGERKRKETA